MQNSDAQFLFHLLHCCLTHWMLVTCAVTFFDLYCHYLLEWIKIWKNAFYIYSHFDHFRHSSFHCINPNYYLALCSFCLKNPFIMSLVAQVWLTANHLSFGLFEKQTFTFGRYFCWVSYSVLLFSFTNVKEN